MDFNEALTKAKEYIGSVNFCEEREDSYTFGYDANDEPTRGGLGSPCVIMKEDGSVHTFHQYVIMHIKDKMPEVIKEYDI